MIYSPLEKVEASQIYEVVEAMPVNSLILVHVIGETLEGDAVDKVVMLPLGCGRHGAERLGHRRRLELRLESGKFLVDNLTFGGAAERQQVDFDWEVADIQRKADRPSKQWFFLPAFGLLALVVILQRRRRSQQTA